MQRECSVKLTAALVKKIAVRRSTHLVGLIDVATDAYGRFRIKFHEIGKSMTWTSDLVQFPRERDTIHEIRSSDTLRERFTLIRIGTAL